MTFRCANIVEAQDMLGRLVAVLTKMHEVGTNSPHISRLGIELLQSRQYLLKANSVYLVSEPLVSTSTCSNHGTARQETMSYAHAFNFLTLWLFPDKKVVHDLS